MKPLLIVCITALSLTACWPATGRCHGVAGSIDPKPGYQVSAMYNDGEPMSYASVEIMAPDSKTAFQLGRTDRNGVMLFKPDQPGRWQVVVSDGMGHRLEVEVEIAAEEGQKGQPVSESKRQVRPGGSRIQSIVNGLAVIFGGFGLVYGWLGRRRVRSSQFHS